MSSHTATNVAAIQRDWQNRELVEIVQLNILHIATFLNNFDKSARFKLASLNEKLNKLERSLEYCEAAVKASFRGNTTTEED